MIWDVTTATMLFPLFILLVGLAFTIGIDPYLSRGHRAVMLVIVVLCVTLIAQNLTEDFLAAGPVRWFWRTTASVYGYTVRPVFLILFLYIIQPEKKHWLAWALAGINCAIHLTAYFSHLCFWFNGDNDFQRGPLAYTCLVVSLILLLELLAQTVRAGRGGRKREILLPILVVGMILTALVLDGGIHYESQPVTFLTIAIVTGSVLYYIWLHLKFVREHEEDLKAQQQIQIMLSQIQPHFLYNVLGTIGNLYSDNPEAQKAIFNFSSYLQGNMYSLTETEPIPFATELAHTKAYLELEQLRFGKKLTVEYDLAATKFLIPTLTLQPLVENAVRHGIRHNKGGAGTVTISSRELPDRWEVTVCDDGPGFDPAQLSSGERPHIGLQNARERLRSVSSGDLHIDSAPGAGCRVTIELPKEEENHADLRHR